MQEDNGITLGNATYNDSTRRQAITAEFNMASAVEQRIFEGKLDSAVRALSKLMSEKLAEFAKSRLPEARAGAEEAFGDPAAAGVHKPLLQPTADALGEELKGEDVPKTVRDAGNLLRLVGTAYEKAAELIEAKFEGKLKETGGFLGALEAALDSGQGEATVSARVAELFPELRGEARSMLLHIVRFGQVQGSYRNGFAMQVLDLAGAPKKWWALEAFNKKTNRRRHFREEPARVERAFDNAVYAAFFGGEDDENIFGDQERLVKSSGRLRWIVQPTSVLFWASRLFGLSEGGDISGTTADAMFVLEGLMMLPESAAVRRAFGERMAMAYLLPMVHMLKEQHHSLLEIAFVYTLNGTCEYVINDYTTLLPKSISPKSAIGEEFIAAVKTLSPAKKLYLDGTNTQGILDKLREGYPLSLATTKLTKAEEKVASDTEGKNLGDFACAVGQNAKVWTMQTADELAAYKQLATCGKSMYRMFSMLRDAKSASKEQLLVAALECNRGAAMNLLCHKAG